MSTVLSAGWAVGSLSRPYFAANSLEVRPLCSMAALQTELALWRSPCHALSPAARTAAYLVTHSFTTPETSGSVFVVDGSRFTTGASVPFGATTVNGALLAGRSSAAAAIAGAVEGCSACDGVVESSAFETSAALAATPTTTALLLRLTTLIRCDHMSCPIPRLDVDRLPAQRVRAGHSSWAAGTTSAE